MDKKRKVSVPECVLKKIRSGYCCVSLPSFPAAQALRLNSQLSGVRAQCGVLPQHRAVGGTLKNRYNHPSYLGDVSMEEERGNFAEVSSPRSSLKTFHLCTGRIAVSCKYKHTRVVGFSRLSQFPLPACPCYKYLLLHPLQ